MKTHNSLVDSRVKFAKWSIVYFNALLDCSVHLKQYSTCWTDVSLGNFAIATKVLLAAKQPYKFHKIASVGFSFTQNCLIT